MAKLGRGSRTNGQGSLLRRAGTPIWYAQYYRDGRQIRVSTGTKIKAKAEETLRRLMGDSERGLMPITDLKKITYGDLRKNLIRNYDEKGNRTLYQTADGEENIGGLKALDAFFGYSEESPGCPVTRITTDAARDFAQKRQAEGFSTATINRSLSALHRMLRLAYEEGKLQGVPVIRRLKEPAPRKGFVTLEQFQKLLAALPVQLRPVVLFLFWCGGRKGEAFQITWDQVDLKARLVRLEQDQTKSEEPRIVPLPPVLVEILEKVTPKEGVVFNTENLRTEWGKACAAVGLGTREKVKSGSGFTWYRYKGMMIHDLRRSAIRNLIAAGVPENVAMKISGHKTASVFRRYNIVTTQDVSNAMDRLVEASSPRVEAELSANLVQVVRKKSRKLFRARSSNG